MSDRTSAPQPTQEDLILAMLRDVLARQAAAMAAAGGDRTFPGPGQMDGEPMGDPQGNTPGEAHGGEADNEQGESTGEVGGESRPSGAGGAVGRSAPESARAQDAGLRPPAAASPRSATASETAETARFDRLARQEPVGDAGLAGLMRRLCLGLVAAAVLINVPVVDGLPLARAVPDSRALVVRDGLLLKGSGQEVYVLEDDQRRWVSSLDAFEHFGYEWAQVHVVEDGFIARFPEGRPLHVLLKCPESPHIYRLENDRKRWIRDIATFGAEGHVWDDVEVVTCSRLRTIPNGSPIPPGAGTPEPDASTGR